MLHLIADLCKIAILYKRLLLLSKSLNNKVLGNKANKMFKMLKILMNGTNILFHFN